MAGIRYRLRAEWRTRWKAALALGLIAGIVGAVTLAAVAGMRRTQTAFDRFHDASKGWDVLVNPDAGAQSALAGRAIERLPGVADASRVDGYPIVNVRGRTPSDAFAVIALASDGRAYYSTSRPKLLRGRMPKPNRADEIFVDRTFARRYGLDVGDTWRPAVIKASAPENIDPSPQLLGELARGEHPDWASLPRLRITGVAVDQSTVVVDQGYDNPGVGLTPAFARKYRPPLMFWGELVRLAPGADMGAFQRHVQDLVPGESIAFQTLANTRAKVERGVRPQAGALSIFAVVVALTGLLVVGQALTRQTYLDAVDHPTLRGLGFTRVQLFSLALWRTLPAAVLAGLVSVLGAFALSPLMPIGIARVAEPDPGFDFDARTLLLGASALVAVLVVLIAVPAWRASRRPSGGTVRPSRIAAALSRAGTTPPAATGVRLALEPGRGVTAVPVRTTVGSAVIAVAAVTGAVVVAASLGHLVDTPRLYGWTWDASVQPSGNTAAEARANIAETGRTLERDPAVAQWSRFTLSSVELDGRPIPAAGRDPQRPRPGFVAAAGRLPRTDREIALGIHTMHDLRVGIGDRVPATDLRGRTVRLRVVGRVVLPGLGTYPGSDKTAPGEGALVTARALRRLGPPFDATHIVIAFRPGLSPAERSAALRRIASHNGEGDPNVGAVLQPSDVVAWGGVRSTPVILALVLVFLATMTLAHGLISSVRRRRRDLALLKTLGFTRRQVSGAVAWQASTVAGLALLFGLPLGIAIGRWSWGVLVDDLGAVAQPIVPWALLALGVPVLLVIANTVAFVPGRIAARLRPATVLRSE